MISQYLAIGALAGLMSGLFGIGGGIIVVPALAALFTHDKAIPPTLTMQMAVGSSLAIMIVTMSSSLYAYHRRLAVRWNTFKQILPFLLLGALVGSFLAQFLSSLFLKKFFSVFLIVMGLKLFVTGGRERVNGQLSHYIQYPIAILIGILSSLLGAGGGIMLVPFFLYCQLDMLEATGTSVACGIGIVLMATFSFMISGVLLLPPIPHSTGYIYWPAFIGIAMASVLFAPIGVALASRLPKALLKRIFGIFMLLMAADMLLLR